MQSFGSRGPSTLLASVRRANSGRQKQAMKEGEARHLKTREVSCLVGAWHP